jgi:hypothetical protein
MIRTTRSNTINNIRKRNRKQTRRHKHRGGFFTFGKPAAHAVAVALEAHHVQHSFFAMLSLASSQKINVIGGLLTGAAAVGMSAAAVATSGLAIVGIGIVIFTAMAIRVSLENYKKLQHTVLALIQVLRKIQKTMMLCITMSIHYKIVINTHDLNVCLSNIYSSLDKLLTPEAREAVKKYAQNYEGAHANVENATDKVIESAEEVTTVSAQTPQSQQSQQSQQSPNRVTAFFSNLGKGISEKFKKARFDSDGMNRELRELMSELTPFLVLLLSQSVLQFMVCQTSMITEKKMVELQEGNDAVKESCQYKDFQLSALLDSVMRITADLDREPANRASHISALTGEVNRIKDIIINNTNYTSFTGTGLHAKLDKLSKIDGTNNYDNLRAALTDLNTYDEQAFFAECRGQTQPVPVGISRAEPSESLSESLDDKQSEKQSETESVSTSLFDDHPYSNSSDHVYSNSNAVVDPDAIGVDFPQSRTSSSSSAK